MDSAPAAGRTAECRNGCTGRHDVVEDGDAPGDRRRTANAPVSCAAALHKDLLCAGVARASAQIVVDRHPAIARNPPREQRPGVTAT
jgi:hypothetical protein